MVIYVPYNPGGGFDTYARMIGPYLKKYLGLGTVVVENRPGAGGNIATNELYLKAKPDGLTIEIMNGPGSIESQGLGQSGVEFQVGKMNYLGRVSFDPGLILAGANSGIKTWKDFVNYKGTVKFAVTGVGSDDYYTDNLLGNIFHPSYTIVSGYNGGNQAMLGVVRGEAQMMANSASSSEALIQSGKLIPLAVVGEAVPSYLKGKNVPLITSVATSSKAKTAMGVLEGLKATDRVFVAPPGVPADRMAVLRQAFDKAMHDPAFVAEANKAHRPLNYLSGQKVQQLMTTVQSGLKQVAPLLKPQKK